MAKDPRKRIVAPLTYSIFPPVHGGQFRAYDLYRKLCARFNITVLSIVPRPPRWKLPRTRRHTLSTGLVNVVVPQSPSHQKEEMKLMSSSGLQMMFDISCRKNARDTKSLASIYHRLAREADIFIFGHPYLFNLAKDAHNGQLLIYDAVDIELLVKMPYYQGSSRFEELITLVREAEHDACENADMIFATNDVDRQTLSELYSVPTSKIRVVPNTVDTSEFIPVVRDEVQAKKEKMGFVGRTALFAGSLHPPNIEAVDFIVESLAPECQDWQFLFTGSISDYARIRSGSVRNVRALGVLGAEEKTRLYSTVDVAINPMLHGSGTNLKMLVYMAAGLPVVTTTVGARGLDITDGEHAVICDLADFGAELERLINDPLRCSQLATNARKLVESRYDSTKIAAYVANLLTSYFEQVGPA